MSSIPSKGFFIGFLVVISLFACSTSKKQTSYDFCKNLEVSKCLEDNFELEMITSKGKVALEINGKNLPLTAGHFMSLVEKGLYDGTVFNRVIKTPHPFIIQGGHKVNASNLQLERNKTAIQQRSTQIEAIPLEIKLKGESRPRYNQLIIGTDNLKKVKFPHVRGSLSMARSNSINSAKIEFFIALKDLPELDGRYSVFGRVVNGMDIIDLIQEGDKILIIKKLP